MVSELITSPNKQLHNIHNHNGTATLASQSKLKQVMHEIDNMIAFHIHPFKFSQHALCKNQLACTHYIT